MRTLDDQIDRIDQLLWELLDDPSDDHDNRVLREAHQAARALRDHAGLLPDQLESFIQWSQFDEIRALAVDVRHGLA